MKYIIGIDAGTTGVKSALFDLEGHEVLVESRDNEPDRIGENMIEQDMTVHWEKVLDTLKGIGHSDLVDPADIIAIGLTGQGEGCWLMDREGNPVQPASLWCDGRANESIAKLTEEQKRQIHLTTGTPALPGACLLQLVWYKEHRPETLDRVGTIFGDSKDWIRYKLTGDIYTDYSDPGCSLIDLKRNEYAFDLIESLGLGEYIPLLPPLLPSEACGGRLTAANAAHTNLPQGLPVVMGALDVMACTVGLGAVNDGDTLAILGTTCCTNVILNQRRADELMGKARVEILGVQDMYLVMMATMAGTPNLDWALNEISDSKSFAAVEARIREIPAGSGGVIFHPYLGSAGERAPFYSPNARASFFGLNATTTRYHLVRAVYESIAFMIKDCLNDYPSENPLAICGGGAKSKVWAQIISDVTGRRVLVHDGTEFGAKGGAMMAGVMVGQFADIHEAAQAMCNIHSEYQPQATAATVYDQLYRLYREARLKFMPLWDLRADIMRQVA